MNINVDKIVERCYAALPQAIRCNPWSILNHGYDVLDSEEKLNAYIASYGEMHIAKCRKALQNFPFDDFCHRNDRGEVTHVEEFEIFDWGCGQGLGALTLLEYLYQRDMLHGVRRVTLIEPSDYALRRAEAWMHQSVSAHTEVRVLSRPIPANDAPRWDDIDCQTGKAIHVMSNIIDIPGVGLRWLADMISGLSPRAYCVCVGPKYGKGVSRISDFHNYMGAPACFADYNAFPFSHTSTTHHPYGIEVKGFVYNNSSGINSSYAEQSEQRYIDEYDTSPNAFAHLLPEAEIKAYATLKQAESAGFGILLHPTINIERPDFILYNINRGIVIVNVCDDISDFNRAFNKVEAIRQSLFDTYLKSLKIDSVIRHAAFYCVKSALFFTSATPEEVETACRLYSGEVNEEQDSVDNPSDFSDEEKEPAGSTRNLLKLFPDDCADKLAAIRTYGFKYEYYQEIKDLILPRWHPSTDGNAALKLTRRQKEILSLDTTRLKVKGVAGCGKTQLIAYESVKENLRTGSKVLILTFNITLIQYIRMRIGEVPADFSYGDFNITNYHKFFSSKAKRYAGGRVELQHYNNPKFFEGYKDKIVAQNDQYKTIIVDEVQDYMPAWIDTLRDYFLAPGGTLMIFGDGEQNIYKRSQEQETKMPKFTGFNDERWRTMSQRVSMRMLNPKIAQLASGFAREFQLSSAPIAPAPALDLFDYKMGYWNVGKDYPAKNIAQNILWILNNYKIAPKDVTVVCQYVEVLRSVDKCYRDYTGLTTTRAIESEEEFKDVMKQELTDGYKLRDIQAIRRAAKVHFTTQNHDMKFATIASFKGWESKTIILLLQSPEKTSQKSQKHDKEEQLIFWDDPSLIYTGLTRAKENIFIVNLGYDKYHQFFQGNIKND